MLANFIGKCQVGSRLMEPVGISSATSSAVITFVCLSVTTSFRPSIRLWHVVSAPLSINYFIDSLYILSQTQPMRWRCVANHALVLTLDVRGRSYFGLTRSISWLLMTWLLTSPGHQQPWFWLCRICRSWPYLKKDFQCLCHINVE